ncbi:MAG: DinB family protein [Acidobacteria bacterium]|nr:DinB family protein [Acidobacteriota bacterium]
MMTPILLLTLLAQAPPEGLGRGWLGEFDLASRQLLQLAEATPAEQFKYSPSPGTRTTAQLYMHVAIGNYFLLNQAGAKTGGPNWSDKIERDTESKISSKAEVIKWLSQSFAAVKEAYPTIDGNKQANFLGKPGPASNVLLRILVHNHEHMGQAIAYARSSGVKPPWSGK